MTANENVNQYSAYERASVDGKGKRDNIVKYLMENYNKGKHSIY